MGQNLAAQTARLAAGGIGFPALDAASNLSTSLNNQTHQQIAASQTKTLLGATGAVNDQLDGILVVPATTSPGAISLYDGSGSTAIVLFTGGATSVADLKPFFVPIRSRAATVATPGWYVTTGAAVSVVAVGNFT